MELRDDLYAKAAANDAVNAYHMLNRALFELDKEADLDDFGLLESLEKLGAQIKTFVEFRVTEEVAEEAGTGDLCQ